MALDGRIFALPYHAGASEVLVIDPSRNTSYLLPEDYGTGSSKYTTSAVALDGRIFAPPYYAGASKVLVIDPSRNTSYLLSQKTTAPVRPNTTRARPSMAGSLPASSHRRVQGAGD